MSKFVVEKLKLHIRYPNSFCKSNENLYSIFQVAIGVLCVSDSDHRLAYVTLLQKRAGVRQKRRIGRTLSEDPLYCRKLLGDGDISSILLTKNKSRLDFEAAFSLFKSSLSTEEKGLSCFLGGVCERSRLCATFRFRGELQVLSQDQRDSRALSWSRC